MFQAIIYDNLLETSRIGQPAKTEEAAKELANDQIKRLCKRVNISVDDGRFVIIGTVG